MVDIHLERNRYAMRRLDGRLRPVHVMLLNWGAWKRRETAKGPPNALTGTTILGRVIEQGLQGASQVGTKPEDPIPPRIAVVEACVGQITGVLKTVLEIRYVQAPHMPLEQQAKRAHMSETSWSAKSNALLEVMHALLSV